MIWLIPLAISVALLVWALGDNPSKLIGMGGQIAIAIIVLIFVWLAWLAWLSSPAAPMRRTPAFAMTAPAAPTRTAGRPIPARSSLWTEGG